MTEESVDNSQRTTPSAGASAGNKLPRAAHAQESGDRPPDSPSESDIWVGRTSWTFFAGRISSWVLILVVLGIGLVALARRVEWLTPWGATKIVLGLGAVSGIILFAGIAWRVLSTRYRVTTQRLFIERGILSQTIDQTELVRVDDVRVSRRLVDRLLGLGTIRIMSTDASDRESTIEGVRDPSRVAEAVRSSMQMLRQRSLYVEHL